MPITVKQLAKKFLLSSCSPDLQHKIRRAYCHYRIMRNRHYREPEMALLRSLVRSGDSTFDIGANVGVYTSELALVVGPAGKVYAFEPVLENYDILTTLVRKAHLDNVFPLRLAIGVSIAQCDILIPDMSGFTGYYWAHIPKPGEAGRTESVKMTTIDHLCQVQRMPRPDFIKCDVEGEELGVVLGGQQTIQSQQPGWLLEVSRETSGQVFGVLHDFGYRAFVFEGRLRHTQTYLDREFSNYFFLHPQSLCWQRMEAH
jgi:FkbM family methyltransferase